RRNRSGRAWHRQDRFHRPAQQQAGLSRCELPLLTGRCDLPHHGTAAGRSRPLAQEQTMKVLVVEDEALLRHHLHTRLSESGHVVDAVADAEEGLYRTHEFNHDLAVIDLGLPGISGLDLIRQLRSNGESFPILILTARGNWQDKVEGLAAGAD